jgi:hypothetical protein
VVVFIDYNILKINVQYILHLLVNYK